MAHPNKCAVSVLSAHHATNLQSEMSYRRAQQVPGGWSEKAETHSVTEEYFMPQVYVHYFIDSVNGLAKIHFSGSRSQANKFIKNKTMFALALTGMQTIPPKDKLWDDKSKTWNVHSDVWVTLMPYYSCAPEIYEMIPYSTRLQWTNFISGKSTPVSNNNGGFNFASDAEAAASFFGTQAFNHAVYATASVNNEREDFISLLGLTKWGDFDSLDNSSAKKLYRAAAVKLHPDKNNGDGSRMARLNELWAIYGGKSK
jgi:hypothetical protein